MGLPSDHFTPSRMVKVSVLLSLLHWKAVASQGEVLAFCSVSTNISGSYTAPMDRPATALLNGLKPQVHRPPPSLEMVSVPFELPLEVDPPPHAASTVAARPPATASASFLKRLIGV